jgi:hypothetical protein
LVPEYCFTTVIIPGAALDETAFDPASPHRPQYLSLVTS